MSNSPANGNVTGIGASVRRREDFRFLTGQGTYTDDINRPNQTHAYILRSPYAHARIKGIDSPVAGHADILVVPDLEAGNMLAKNLTFLANADAAGIVLGARVPIVLTSRADSVMTRMASCAVAALYAHRLRLGNPIQG